MESYNFKISGEFIKNQNKLVSALLIVIPLVLIMTAAILLDFRIDRTYIIIMLITLIILETAIYLSMRITLKKMKDNELRINDTELIRVNRSLEEKVPLDSITGIKTVSYGKDNLLALRIFNDKRTISIGGFEKMDEVLKILSDKLSDRNIVIKNKKMAINFNNPFVLSAYLIVICLLFALAIRFNRRIYNHIQLFIPVFIGAYFLIFRPMTGNAGRRFFAFEITMGIILVVIGMLNVFLKYFLLR